MNNFKFDLEITEEESSGQNFILCKRLLDFMKLISLKDYGRSYITKIQDDILGVGVGIHYKKTNDIEFDFIGYRTYCFNDFVAACEQLKTRLINSIIDHCSYSTLKCNYEIKNYIQLTMIMDLMGI